MSATSRWPVARPCWNRCAGYHHLPGRAQSSDGLCRSFDYRSSGTTYSSGIGVVALRRLSDALADGDPILAVRQGKRGRQRRCGPVPATPRRARPGWPTSSAPRCGWPACPRTTCGTSRRTAPRTPLGDHVELVGAERRVCGEHRPDVGFCGLGSVKTNLGHCRSGRRASRASSRPCTSRTPEHLPPHPFFDRARDQGELAESPFFLSDTAQTCSDENRRTCWSTRWASAARTSPPCSPRRPPARHRRAERDIVRLVLSGTPGRAGRMSKQARRRAGQRRARRPRTWRTRCGSGGTPSPNVGSSPRRRTSSRRRAARAPSAAGPDDAQRAFSRRACAPRTGTVGAPALLHGLLAALPDRTEVLRAGDPRSRGPVLVALTDDLEGMVADAWLNGVEVNWEAIADGRGRRVVAADVPVPAQALLGAGPAVARSDEPERRRGTRRA